MSAPPPTRLALKPMVGLRSLQRMVSGPLHETTQGRPATAIGIPVVFCGAPDVKTKILSTNKEGPGCKHRSRSHEEEWRSVFV